MNQSKQTLWNTIALQFKISQYFIWVSSNCTMECFECFCVVVKSSAENMNLQIFDAFSHEFSLFSTFYCLWCCIGLIKDWIHVRKHKKFAKSFRRPTFSQPHKNMPNIPLCNWMKLMKKNIERLEIGVKSGNVHLCLL